MEKAGLGERMKARLQARRRRAAARTRMRQEKRIEDNARRALSNNMGKGGSREACRYLRARSRAPPGPREASAVPLRARSADGGPDFPGQSHRGLTCGAI